MTTLNNTSRKDVKLIWSVRTRLFISCTTKLRYKNNNFAPWLTTGSSTVSSNQLETFCTSKWQMPLLPGDLNGSIRSHRSCLIPICGVRRYNWLRFRRLTSLPENAPTSVVSNWGTNLEWGGMIERGSSPEDNTTRIGARKPLPWPSKDFFWIFLPF